MDWRILAAAMAVLVVLGSGTLLAAQVQNDLDAGVDTRLGEIAQRESPPLKLNDMKLPHDLPLDIPPGAEISPDLSQLTLPRDLDLSIPNDLDLSGLDFALPEDLNLELPEGTIFSPPGLELPQGANIRLPDGREFEIPAGSKLDLPPELVERLLAQGLPTGRLNAPRSFELNDLPPGLHATLDPPQFEGGGRLHLPEGTTITLPDGRKFPFPPGVLPYAARYLLPEGTTIDVPFGDGFEGSGFPVPRPLSPSQLVNVRSGVASQVYTEITGMPTRVRKGEPMTVSGYVRDAAGKPVAGAPVDVFMNESKKTPGVLVGQGASDASGTFVITLTLPTDKPASSYQLVNHASAFIDRAGKAWSDGWGDPPFATYATTTLKLDVPARDGLGSSTPIAGTLVDHTGTPVPNVPLTINIDGVGQHRATTNAQGRFSLSFTLSAGSHVIEARFLGNGNYEASSARASITIDDYALDISPTLRARPGDTLTLTGRVLGKGAVAPERSVVVSGVFGDTLNLVSDSTGRFTYSYATSRTQAPGLYTLTYRVPEHNVTKTQTVELNLSARLTIEAPRTADVEEAVPVTVTLRGTATNAPVISQLIRITLSGPGGVSEMVVPTDSTGTATTTIRPLREAPGTYTATARPAGNPYLDAPAVSTTVSLGQLEVTWEMPTVVVRGEDSSGAITLRFLGRPLANAPVTLDYFGARQLTTDANGRIEWTANVPGSAKVGSHEVRLETMDHEPRTRDVEVIAATRLELDLPERFERGKPVDASLRLVDDQGDPVRDARVLLVGPGVVANVTTDANGRWSGPLNITTPGGNVTLAAEYDGRSPYLGSQSIQTMSASAPFATLSRNLWVYPLVLGVAIAAGGGAWYAAKKLPRRSRASAPATLVAPAPALAPPDFDVRFGIPADEPPVWGLGEPLALTVINRGASGEFALTHAGGTARVKLGAGSSAQNDFRFPEEGEVSLSARRDDAPDMDAASASVRIVDYRKETAREFDLFLEKVKELEPTLTKRSTPREIAWTLAGRLGSEAEAHLDEIALVLEITNYSQQEVSRAHYLRFVRAARALDPFFAPPAPAGG